MIWFLFDITSGYNHQVEFSLKKKKKHYTYKYSYNTKKISILTEILLLRLKLYYVSPPPCLVTVLGKTHALCIV